MQSVFTNSFWHAGRYSAAVLTDRSSPFWYIGHERQVVEGESRLVQKDWSLGDPVIHRYYGGGMVAASQWRPRGQEQEDLDILGDAMIMRPTRRMVGRKRREDK